MSMQPVNQVIRDQYFTPGGEKRKRDDIEKTLGQEAILSDTPPPVVWNPKKKCVWYSKEVQDLAKRFQEH